MALPSERPPSSPSLDLLSILPPRPSAPTPRSSKSLPPRGLFASKIFPSSSTAPFPDPDNSPSALEPLLSLQTVRSPGDSQSDSALSNAHAILWDHFGFIPNHPDLDLDGYKLPSPFAPPSVTQRNIPANLNLSRTSISSSPHSSLPKMAKKRRSLQAILVPSFLPQASSSTAAVSPPPPSRARSHTVTSPNDLNSVEYSPDWLAFYSGAASPGSELSSIGPVTPSRNSPPPDLLDEDPFANLSPAPSLRGSRATSPVRSVFDVFSDGLEPAPATPRSPLAQTAQLEEGGHRVLRHASSFTSFQAMSHPPSTPPPTPTEPSKPQLIRRPKSSGPPQVRPAYTRPAFAPRPSLPSLNTLARTSIHIPKVRRGRPGAHLPLEPWEDPAPSPVLGSSELSEPPSPMATRSVPSSPPARRRGHLRRPTLSMIRDSRMFLDGESADDGGVPPLELEPGSEDKEPSSARATPTPESCAAQDAESLRRPSAEWEQTHEQEREDIGMGTSFLSISPEDRRGVFPPQADPDQPPTPPPKSPGSLTWHARSVSETSTTSTCTVPSLCPSSPTSTSSESADHPHFHIPSHSLGSSDPSDDPRSLSHPYPHHDSYHPHSHPHVHIDTEPAEHTTYPSVFAPHPFQHHRDTQLLTSDLLASLEYDYSEALSRLSVAAATGLNVPLAPSALFPGSSSSSPVGDFEPGSSAGTIRNVAVQARTLSSENEDGASSGNAKTHHHHHHPRLASDDSAESKWSTEATDAHAFLHAPHSPISPPELPSSSSEPSTGTTSPSPSPSCSRSPSLSPCTPLSRSRSSSTVSSEYDFGDEEYGYYSYDLGPFADPLDAPSHEQQQHQSQQQHQQDPLRASPQHPRPVFGYGIPWPSTHHRASAASGGSGGSVSDVLSDLEDLAEDLTERFSLSLSLRSAATSVRSSELYTDAEDGKDTEGDVFSSDDGLADADGYSSSSRRNGRPSGGSSQGHSYNGGGGSSSNGHSGYSRNGGGTFRRGSAGHGGNDGDDDDDDDERRKRRPARLPLSVTASILDSETSEDEEDEDEEESSVDGSPRATRTRQRHDTTRPGMYTAAPPPSASVPNAPASPGAADDDVPLARQIPTALKAQRTIRRQVRDELDQKRQERRAARAQQALLAQPPQQQPTRALSSAGETAPPPVPLTGSSPPRPGGRPRTRTLPSTVSSPFSVGDLTKKLLGLQAAPAAPATAPPMPPVTARSKRPSLEAHDQHGYASASASSARGRTMTVDPHTYTASSSRAASRPPPPDAGRSLRPVRSFHRPRTGDADAYVPPPIPTTSERTSAELQRRATTASRQRPEEPPAFLSTAPAPPDARTVAALDRARSLRSAKSSSSRRPSIEKSQRPEPESISASRARASAATATAAVASPASTFAQPAGKGAGQMMWQQRVFIGNMQRFCLVEIGSATSAGDVLGMVDAQGALDQGAGSGGWMLWEVSQDFGMERPIRSFELLSDVCGAWNTDKTVNLLVIKKTLLAPLLNPKAMPSASPMCSGYVQWEYKRGKWQKRWMELREHSLWLSKRDTGKDATFLCSLNNFDAYYVTRVHKAPKPYVFSVKSTDSLSFFESTSDYVHVFSCGEGEGKNWLEKILLARSYVLYQERNVLSSQSASGTAAAAGGGLQRSGTRKQAPGQRPAQPLVNVGAPKADPLSVPSGFEPAAGSLLARRHG